MTEAVKDVGPKYPANVLNAFEVGALLDLRMRLAVDFLKSPIFEGAFHLKTTTLEDVRFAAGVAIDLASALLDVGAERGLVASLPEHGEITAALKRHIERSVAAGSFQAQESNRAARGMGPTMIHPMNG